MAGEVRCDDVFVQLFASDASIYEIKPLGVVRPRSTADVAACVRYAAEKRIPIHARGAGTGVAGESLGPGLILDFSAHLRRVIRIDADRVRVQPGVVHERLNEQLRRQGRMFGPDPATSAVTTLGSMLAIDAAGSRWLKYGSTRRHVQSLQVVLADGQVLELGREPLADGQSTSTIPRKRELVNRLAALLAEKAELIRRNQPNCPQNHCGYNLVDVLGEGYIDVARLLVGSEGTLALITEATLGTEPLPRHRGVALLLFDSLDKAARAVPDILASNPTACDLMDRRHLSLAREAEPRFEQLIPPETEAVLLVEQDGEDPLEVRSRLHRLVGELWQQKRIVFGARQAFERRRSGTVLAADRQGAAGAVPGVGAEPPAADRRGHGGFARGAARFSGADAKRAQAPSGDRLALLPRRPGATPRPAVSRSGQPRRRAADAAAGRGTLPGGVRRPGEHQRRARLRAEPHGRSCAGRPASCSTCSSKSSGSSIPTTFSIPARSSATIPI